MVLGEADTWIAGNTASNLGYRKERYWALEVKVWCDSRGKYQYFEPLTDGFLLNHVCIRKERRRTNCWESYLMTISLVRVIEYSTEAAVEATHRLELPR